MTADELRAFAREVARETAREVLAEFGQRMLGTTPAPAPLPVEGPAKLMPVSTYARAKGVSEGTIKNWIAAGMPTVPARRGVRVNVAAAEVWIASGGASLTLTARGRRLDA